MVADGMAPFEAYRRAGGAPNGLGAAKGAVAWLEAPQVRARIDAILEARRAAGAVSLEEITDMLRQVYAGARQDAEYGAAHNAAFSLARLHGLVVDRTQIDVIRRPTREPDAPAETSLEGWMKTLPGPKPLELQANPPEPQGSGLEPQGSEPQSPNDIKGLEIFAGLEPQGSESSNEINDLAPFQDLERPGRSENGAPIGTVTGTPQTGRRIEGQMTEVGNNSQGPSGLEPGMPVRRKGRPPGSKTRNVTVVKAGKKTKVPLLPEKRVLLPRQKVPAQNGGIGVLPKASATLPKKPLSGAEKRKRAKMRELFGP